jgi:hypothetical protein
MAGKKARTAGRFEKISNINRGNMRHPAAAEIAPIGASWVAGGRLTDQGFRNGPRRPNEEVLTDMNIQIYAYLCYSHVKI